MGFRRWFVNGEEEEEEESLTNIRMGIQALILAEWTLFHLHHRHCGPNGFKVGEAREEE